VNGNKRYGKDKLRTKRVKLLAAICLVAVGAAVHAIDWPVTGVVPTSNFAQNDGGAPLLGVTFAYEGPLYAAEQGEVIFQRNVAERVSGLPSPLGSWVAVDLDNGLVSIYARYGESEAAISSHIEKQQIIAQAGKSGANEHETGGFYFSFFDRKEHRWINPAVIINPMPDTRPPQIGTVRLKSTESGLINLAQTRTIKQGRYAIFAEADDTIDGGMRPLAPNSLAAFVNGAEAGTLLFESFSARDGLLMIYRNELVSANRIYAEPNAYETGEFWFSRGIATLELIIGDRAGNARTASYRIIVE
jgi:hypothetical protein